MVLGSVVWVSSKDAFQGILVWWSGLGLIDMGSAVLQIGHMVSGGALLPCLQEVRSLMSFQVWNKWWKLIAHGKVLSAFWKHGLWLVEAPRRGCVVTPEHFLQYTETENEDIVVVIYHQTDQWWRKSMDFLYTFLPSFITTFIFLEISSEAEIRSLDSEWGSPGLQQPYFMVRIFIPLVESVTIPYSECTLGNTSYRTPTIRWYCAVLHIF